jgi:hypothetical protein
MDMSEVEGMDMVEEHDHPMNYRLGEEDMNMMGSNMVEVDGMDMMDEHFYPMNHRPEVDDTDMVEEHFHPMNHQPEVEGIDTVEEHFHPINHRPEVEGMDTVDTGIGEDRAAELEVVERESEGTVLLSHWIGEASLNSSRVGGACETGLFKRSTHVCNSGLQL